MDMCVHCGGSVVVGVVFVVFLVRLRCWLAVVYSVEQTNEFLFGTHARCHKGFPPVVLVWHWCVGAGCT